MSISNVQQDVKKVKDDVENYLNTYIIQDMVVEDNQKKYYKVITNVEYMDDYQQDILKEYTFDEKTGDLLSVSMQTDNRDDINYHDKIQERADNYKVLSKELESIYERQKYYPCKEETNPITMSSYIPLYGMQHDDDVYVCINLEDNTLDVKNLMTQQKELTLPLKQVREDTNDFKKIDSVEYEKKLYKLMKNRELQR